MKENSDPVRFQTQVQAQSYCFSQLTAVLFERHLLCSFRAGSSAHHCSPPSPHSCCCTPPLPTATLPFKVPERHSYAEVVLLLCHPSSPCPAVEPVLALTGSCLVLQLRAGVSLLIHADFYSTDLREVML